MNETLCRLLSIVVSRATRNVLSSAALMIHDTQYDYDELQTINIQHNISHRRQRTLTSLSTDNAYEKYRVAQNKRFRWRTF